METLKICKALHDEGHSVALICPAGSTLEKECNSAGLHTVPILDKKYSLKNLQAIRQLLSESNFDVIHVEQSHDLWTVVPALALSKINTKLILSKHVASRVVKRDFLHKMLYKRLDHIISISEFIRKNVIETTPIDPDKAMTIYNGIPDEIYYKYNSAYRWESTEYQFPSSAIVVGIVGRFSPMKGHIEFLKAAKIIIDTSDLDIRFLVVGGASYKEEAFESELMDLFRELNLEDRITFTGFMENVFESMSVIDILAFPSHKESFGNTLIEGMTMSLPVVASNSGAVPEIVKDGINGFLVPPQDPIALAEKLIVLIENEKLRREMGVAGRIMVEKKFLFSKYLSELTKLYKADVT